MTGVLDKPDSRVIFHDVDTICVSITQWLHMMGTTPALLSISVIIVAAIDVDTTDA